MEKGSYLGEQAIEKGSVAGSMVLEKGTELGGTVVGKAQEGIGKLEENDNARPVIEKSKSAISYGVSTASWIGSSVFNKMKTLIVDEEDAQGHKKAE